MSGCGRWLVGWCFPVDVLWDRASGRPTPLTDPYSVGGDRLRTVLAGDRLVRYEHSHFHVTDPVSLATGAVSSQEVSPEVAPYALASRPDGRLVGSVRFTGLSGSPRGFVGWELVNGRPTETWRQPVPGLWHIRSFHVSSGGGWLAAQGTTLARELVLELRRTADGTLGQALPAVEASLLGVTDAPAALLDDGRQLVKAGVSGVSAVPVPGRGTFRAVAASPSGDVLLIARGPTVASLTADTLAVRRRYILPVDGTPTCLAFAPDGLTAACGTSKGEVVIWDVD